MRRKNQMMRTLLTAAVCVAALSMPARAADTSRAGGPSSTDEARSWAALQRMKAMDVMHMVDTDKKGFVTREEFMKFQEQLFDRMDRDHDGKVDAKEWMGKSAGAKTAGSMKK